MTPEEIYTIKEIMSDEDNHALRLTALADKRGKTKPSKDGLDSFIKYIKG